MSKTIANFLVGIGLNTTNFSKGAGNVESSLGRIRALSGVAGAGIGAAFSAASLAAINAGKKLDDFSLKTEGMSTSSQYIYALGGAFRTMGGDADDAISTLKTMEKALDNLRAKGDIGPLKDAVFAGVDISALTSSTSGADMLQRLSDIVPKLNDQQQRVLQEGFGFSDATMRVLRRGRGELDAAVNDAMDLAGGIQDATEKSREFNKEMSRLGLVFDGIGNSLASHMLPGFTGILKSITDFLQDNRGGIEAGIKKMADNPAATSAIVGGGAVAATSAAIGAIGSKLGMKWLAGAGTAGAYGGIAGAALGTGAMLYDLKSSDVESITGLKNVSRYYRSPSETVDAIRGGWGNQTEADVRAMYEPSDIGYVHSGAVNPEQSAKMRQMSALARSDASIPPPIVNTEISVVLDGKTIDAAIQKRESITYQNAVQSTQTTTSR